MRVTFDQLLRNAVANIVKGKDALFVFHFGVEYDLQQQIAQLLQKQFLVLLVDGFDDFVGFLDEIFFDALVRLLCVPRTSARRTQKLHDAQKVIYRISFLEFKILNHSKVASLLTHSIFILTQKLVMCKYFCNFFSLWKHRNIIF